jgi:hypothetical protein
LVKKLESSGQSETNLKAAAATGNCEKRRSISVSSLPVPAFSAGASCLSNLEEMAPPPPPMKAVSTPTRSRDQSNFGLNDTKDNFDGGDQVKLEIFSATLLQILRMFPLQTFFKECH